MLSPVRQLAEVNPSFLALAMSFASSLVMCNRMIRGRPSIIFLQATHLSFGLLLDISGHTVHACCRCRRNLHMSDRHAQLGAHGILKKVAERVRGHVTLEFSF
jgi:hypothetical protein